MPVKLLILGGTSEASALARAVAARGIDAVISYAGRVERPRKLPIPRRVGGFGGAGGLAEYLRANAITHVVDATHPFAAQMSRNAVDACARTGVPLVALTRPAWTSGPGDDWREVPDIASAVAALDGPPRRAMLAIGRMHLAEFVAQPQHDYLLRLVDPPEEPPPLPHHSIVVSRGPFTVEGDTALLREHGIELVVAKNAGGGGARAKLDAARALGLPIIMIARPPAPERREVTTPEAVLDWLDHAGTDLGV
jgi:precorrin-6A/cobalt-precorrin-6A reductase